MSIFRVNVDAANTADRSRTTTPVQALVDTRSELTSLSADVLQTFGIATITLLGVRTLEAFGVMVDYIAHRFVATTTIVACRPSC
jgi:hypothetical protein